MPRVAGCSRKLSRTAQPWPWMDRLDIKHDGMGLQGGGDADWFPLLCMRADLDAALAEQLADQTQGSVIVTQDQDCCVGRTAV
jgi:hypothetical protein